MGRFLLSLVAGFVLTAAAASPDGEKSSEIKEPIRIPVADVSAEEAAILSDRLQKDSEIGVPDFLVKTRKFVSHHEAKFTHERESSFVGQDRNQENGDNNHKDNTDGDDEGAQFRKTLQKLRQSGNSRKDVEEFVRNRRRAAMLKDDISLKEKSVETIDAIIEERRARRHKDHEAFQAKMSAGSSGDANNKEESSAAGQKDNTSKVSSDPLSLKKRSLGERVRKMRSSNHKTAESLRHNYKTSPGGGFALSEEDKEERRSSLRRLRRGGAGFQKHREKRERKMAAQRAGEEPAEEGEDDTQDVLTEEEKRERFNKVRERLEARRNARKAHRASSLRSVAGLGLNDRLVADDEDIVDSQTPERNDAAKKDDHQSGNQANGDHMKGNVNSERKGDMSRHKHKHSRKKDV